MKRVRQRAIAPRNPLAIDRLLRKGGPRQRKDKRASRARQKAALHRHKDEG